MRSSTFLPTTSQLTIGRVTESSSLWSTAYAAPIVRAQPSTIPINRRISAFSFRSENTAAAVAGGWTQAQQRGAIVDGSRFHIVEKWLSPLSANLPANKVRKRPQAIVFTGLIISIKVFRRSMQEADIITQKPRMW